VQRKARRVARGPSATAPISVRRLQIELGSQSLEVRARPRAAANLRMARFVPRLEFAGIADFLKALRERHGFQLGDSAIMNWLAPLLCSVW
jgi:hypothetical protein